MRCAFLLRCTPLTLRTCYTQSVILNLGVSPMRRREFIAALSAAATLPISAHAQQPLKIWRIGVLESATRELNTPNMNVFLKTLREYGYIEGENLVIEYRSTGGRNERLPELVSELMRLKVNLMLVRGTPEILAVKKATSTIPVVMFAVADPVGLGVAASLSHPGGNITGMDSFTTEVETKRLGLLKELLPEMKRMAFLGDFRNSAVQKQWNEVESAARPLNLHASRLDIRSALDVSRAFDAAMKEKVDAIRVGIDGTTRPNRQLIIDLAETNKIPAIYAAKEFVEDGGLMAYATNYAELYSRAATFVDKIFKGANPADLPIERPTKLELVISAKTAKTIGIEIPVTLLARADEVIE